MISFRGAHLKELGSIYGTGIAGVPNSGGQTLDELLLSLNPTLYSRFDETVGNLINYGSDGNSAAVNGCTQGLAGQTSDPGAYLYDGVDDFAVFANADIAGTVALTSQRWMFLVNAATLGEIDRGVFFRYNDALHLFAFSPNNVINALIDTDTIDANATSNNNQVDFLTEWALIFMDYDDGDTLGLGREIRIFRATAASATTLLTLATNTAGTGAVVPPATDLYIGNRQANTYTFDGLIDLAFGGPGVWSPAGSPADLSIPDQIRSLVFGV